MLVLDVVRYTFELTPNPLLNYPMKYVQNPIPIGDKSQVGCTKSRQKYFIVVRYFCFIWERNQETVPLLHEKMRTSFPKEEGNRARKMDR